MGCVCEGLGLRPLIALMFKMEQEINYVVGKKVTFCFGKTDKLSKECHKQKNNAS